MARELNTNRDFILANFRGGIKQLRDIVSVTYGPSGLNVLIDKTLHTPTVTKDGVSVATEVFINNPLAAAACEIVKEAAHKVVDEVGDGTTTTIILIDKLLSAPLEKRPPAEIVSGLKAAEDVAIQCIEKLSSRVETAEQIEAIARIASNNDSHVAELISDAYKKTGHATILVTESKSIYTTINITQGMEINRGWMAPQFANKTNMCWEEENVRILLYEGKVNSINQLVPILEHCNKNAIPLLIVADEFDGDVLSALLVNSLRGSVKICTIRSPLFEQKRELLMEDLAIVTGGMVISSKSGTSLDDLGHAGKRESFLGTAKTVRVSKDSTTILSTSGKEEVLKQRIEQTRSMMETDWENKKFHEARLARLTGGVSEIRVGGETDVEMMQRMDRIDDAVCATKAAINSGFVPGAGYSLVLAANEVDKLGTPQAKALAESLREPYRLLHGNKIDIFRVENNDVFGIDLQTGNRVWLKQNGIIDPTGVLVQTIRAAISCAISLFTTGGTITMNKTVDPMDDVKYSRRN